MPIRAPSVCGHCKLAHPSGVRCERATAMDRERKARFDKTRPTARQRGYTAEWVKESKAFLAANPKCKRCDQSSTVVDHIEPHKGNQRLFWNRANWQPLCSHHHNSAKQAEERRAAQEVKS